MSSREERERGWRTNPEAATASGGHLTPDAVPADAWADPLTAPLPSELEMLERDRRERERARPELDRAMGSVSAQARTEMFPPSEQTLRSRETQQQPVRRTVRRRVPVRRVKRTLRHIDPLTVLKLSAFYWAVFLLVWLVFVAIVYSFVNSLGTFDALEDLWRDFELDGRLNLTLGLFEKWAFLIGLTFALLTTLLNVFLAFLYNVAADLIGGLELTFVERDSSSS